LSLEINPATFIDVSVQSQERTSSCIYIYAC